MFKPRVMNLWQYLCYYRQTYRTKRFTVKDIRDNYYKAKNMPPINILSFDDHIKELVDMGYLRQSNIVKEGEEERALYYEIVKIEDYRLLDEPFLT